MSGPIEKVERTAVPSKRPSRHRAGMFAPHNVALLATLGTSTAIKIVPNGRTLENVRHGLQIFAGKRGLRLFTRAADGALYAWLEERK